MGRKWKGDATWIESFVPVLVGPSDAELRIWPVGLCYGRICLLTRLDCGALMIASDGGLLVHE